MKNLGKSIEKYSNSGALIGFWLSIIIMAIFVVVALIAKLDEIGLIGILCSIAIFALVAVYLYFKSKTAIEIMEHGLIIKTMTKKHEILYDEIDSLDKTSRVGKSGNTVYVFYLLVVVTKDGQRITAPARVSKEFMMKLLEVSHL